MNFGRISDDCLVARLKSFVGCERRLVAKVVMYLVEVEKRRLHLAGACTSMHDFCTRKLGMSEGETHRRLVAARLVADFPQLFEPLSHGRLLLTHLVELRPFITATNVDAIIEAASGKTKKDIAELIARLAPRPDVPSVVTRIQEEELLLSSPADRGGHAVAPTPVVPASRQVSPLAPERYQVTFTGGTELRDLIELARDLLRHRNPNGDLGPIVELAMRLLVTHLEKERFAKTARPRKSRGSKDPASITAATRREVSARDEYRCTFRSVDGERCPARGFLEVDHVQPRACGGAGDAANARTLCAAHNRHEAEPVFGTDFVARKIDLRQRHQRACANGIVPEPVDPMSQSSFAPSPLKGTPSTQSAEPVNENSHRELIRGALVRMGFGAKDADRAIVAMPVDQWSRPLEALVRDALGRLT